MILNVFIIVLSLTESSAFNWDLSLTRNVASFHLLVYAKNGGRNRVAFITICIKKYNEPTVVANVKAAHLSGNSLTHPNALTRPQSPPSQMFFRHLKRGTAEQAVAVKVPFRNQFPSTRLTVPSLNDVIDGCTCRTCNEIVADDKSGWKDAVVGQSGIIDFCSAINSE